MIYKIFLTIFLLVIVSCSKPDPNNAKQYLEGYWEIKTVEMPSGKTKNFDINTLIDYIEIKGDSGSRTKVSPNLDGTFTTNGLSEKFILKIEDDSLRMFYKTTFAEWKETVIKAQDSILTVRNRDNKTYTYTKFQKFEFE